MVIDTTDADTLPQATATVRAMIAAAPFVSPVQLEAERGAPFRLRLGSNESAFDVAPGVLRAAADARSMLNLYPDPQCTLLRGELSRRLGVPVRNLLVAGGCDELLALCVRLFLAPGELAVAPHGGYPTFAWHVTGVGARVHTVAYRAFRSDLTGMCEMAAALGARLVYLANPDNPTGSFLVRDALRAALSPLPATAAVLLDEAYLDFAPPDEILGPALFDPRVIRLRSFSKAHGLAALRVGYLIADARYIELLDRVRLHYGVGQVAQACALAALRDDEFLRSVVAEVARGRRDYEALAERLGLATLPSATNFVAFAFDTANAAAAVQHELERRDVFVRRFATPPHDRCLRVTVGTAAQRRLFGELFSDAVMAWRAGGSASGETPR